MLNINIKNSFNAECVTGPNKHQTVDSKLITRSADLFFSNCNQPAKVLNSQCLFQFESLSLVTRLFPDMSEIGAVEQCSA
jgi:hypothetical protein